MVATPPGNDGLAGNGLVVLCETPLYVQLNVSGVVTPRCPVKRTTGRTVVAKPVVIPQPAAPVVPIAVTFGVVGTPVNATLWVVPVPDALQNSNTTFETPSQANGVVNTILLVPKPVAELESMKSNGYIENWICYLSHDFSAKELTIFPGQTVTITDNAAYGLIMMQGHGKMGVWDIETPALIRYGQLTHDEYFVSEKAAMSGVKITNHSKTDPIVMLKHFGPGNPDLGL
jgi:hypothetical protein